MSTKNFAVSSGQCKAVRVHGNRHAHSFMSEKICRIFGIKERLAVDRRRDHGAECGHFVEQAACLLEGHDSLYGLDPSSS